MTSPFPLDGSFLDDEPRLEYAMQIWEANGAKLSRTAAAVDGLILGLSTIPLVGPLVGIPDRLRAAKHTSADAALRSAYHQGRLLISLNTDFRDKYTRRDARHGLALIIRAVEEAAGLR